MNCKFQYSLLSAAVVPGRAALLIHCSAEEAKIIRERATQQRRTVSGYVLNVMMRVIRRPVGPKTTMLLRCSAQESTRIRVAAKRRGATISAFVLRTLRSSWNLPLQSSHASKRPAPRQKAKE
jgi:uncharacterized protein (DUF1778 family)